MTMNQDKSYVGRLISVSFGFSPDDSDEQHGDDGSDYLVVKVPRGLIEEYPPCDVRFALELKQKS